MPAASVPQNETDHSDTKPDEDAMSDAARVHRHERSERGLREWHPLPALLIADHCFRHPLLNPRCDLRVINGRLRRLTIAAHIPTHGYSFGAAAADEKRMMNSGAVMLPLSLILAS